MATRSLFVLLLTGAALLSLIGPGVVRAEDPTAKANPVVLLETSAGSIRIELDPDRAPRTVENFLRYVKADFYAGTIFHRVLSDFVVQGGGYNANLRQKAALFPPIPLEVKGGAKNLRGTVAMARTDEPGSATCQFFINVEDNPSLDYDPGQKGENGYAVFGRVTAGMDTVDKIRNAPVAAGSVSEAVPTTPILIKSARLVDEGKAR